MTPAFLAEVMEATWPPDSMRHLGPICLRDGAGGGKRVSAASADGTWTEADLAAAEAAMERPLFVIREGEDALDAALASRGYAVADPVVAYAAPVAALVGEVPSLSAFPHWPPLQIVRSLWAEGGIGPARVAVMERVSGQKTALLARVADKPAGAAFVALHGSEAMLHALEVGEHHRRQGVGANLLRAGANWAASHGALRYSLVVTERNFAARGLYARAGMEVVGHYHYRAR